MFQFLKLIIYLVGGVFISYLNTTLFKVILGLKQNLYNIEMDQEKPTIILGTGQSINEIQKSQWTEFRTQNTIGVNFFLLHEFVPKIIQLELKDEPGEVLSNLEKIFKHRKNDFENSIILIKSNHNYSFRYNYKRIKLLKKLPKTLLRNLRFTLDFPVPSQTVEQYQKTIQIFEKYKLLTDRFLIVPHLRASIGLSVALCMKKGIKEVKFAGVDLINKNVFFDSKDLKKKYDINIPELEINKTHDTYNENISEVTILKVMSLLKTNLRDCPKFCVLSSKSALNQIMEYQSPK